MKTPLILCAITLLDSGCGGSNTPPPSLPPPPPPRTITGVVNLYGGVNANAGITAKCITGTPATTQTKSDGTFTLTMGDQTFPCIIQSIVPTTANWQKLEHYSFAIGPGATNITAVADMIVANALGSDPSDAFTGFNSSIGYTIQGNLDNAKAKIKTLITVYTKTAPVKDLLTGDISVHDADEILISNFGLQTSILIGLAFKETLGKLIAPSTFKMVGVVFIGVNNTTQSGGFTFIYDAQNGFGALVRTTAVCPLVADTTGILYWTNPPNNTTLCW